ncbi:MAG: winged helix-turn-helix domain-containing protein [Acidobacteriota bacterium]
MAVSSQPRATSYHFDDVLIDCYNFSIQKNGTPRSLTPRAFDVLLFLVENRGRVVEKQELFDQIWKDAFVTDNALTRAIKEIRQTIGDDADSPRYIETVPRRGYRFICDVKEDADFIRSPAPRVEPVVIPTVASHGNKIRVSRATLLLSAIALAAIVVISIFVWKLKTGESPTAPASPIRTAQITTWTGMDIYPTLSPDGSSVAYSSDHAGSFEIYVKPLATGGREIQLTSDGGQNLQPAWSPDGKLIAYHSKTRGGIWVIPALGGAARRLSEFGSRPSWSPDGGAIAFQSGGISDLGTTAFTMPPSTIWRVSLQGGHPTPVTQVGQPSGGHGSPRFSPDGKRLVFVASDTGLSEMWTVSSGGGDLKRLAPTHKFHFDPLYSPDGEWIYYSASSGSINFGLWRLKISKTGEGEGTPIEVTSTGLSLAKHLSISADGKRLAYTLLNQTSDLATIALSADSFKAASEPRMLTSDTSYRKTNAAFSPDGRRIAFNVWRAGVPFNVWVVDTDGKNITQMTTDPVGLSLVDWLPGGDAIAIRTQREGRPVICSINLRDGRERLLTEVTGDIFNPKISPDGKSIAFNSRRSGTVNVWIAPLEGGEPRQLTFDSEMMGFAHWSPDGRWLAMEMKRGDDSHIAIIPSGGGEAIQLTADRGQSWTGGWSPDGDKIVFAGERGGVWNIYWVSRSTREQRQLTSHTRPNTYVRYPVWSPLGNQIVYEYAETTGNVWVMEMK